MYIVFYISLYFVSNEVLFGDKSNKFKGINFSSLSIISILSLEVFVDESSEGWKSAPDLII